MNPVRASLVFLLTSAALATAAEFRSQTITVASDQGWWVASHLADVDDDRLTDLLVLLPAQNELHIYRQRKSGFAAAPDQAVALPDQTAWVALRDVDPQEGQELVISTAAGLVYLRQNRGAFEPVPRTLVEIRQVFTTDRLRIVPNPPGTREVNDALPVIFEDRAIWYERDDDYAWRVGKTVDLFPTETSWDASEESLMTGPTTAHSLYVTQAIRVRPQDDQAQEKDKEKKATQALIERIAKDARWRRHDAQRQDVNGDGREDLILWQNHGDMGPGTTIVLLLRGSDGRLPEQPTRVLRHAGLPIRVNRRLGTSPFWDLDGDGRCELILTAIKTRVTSWSGLADLALSGGLDWTFTVWSGRSGDYSGRPDFQMDATSAVPTITSVFSVFLLDGDFNGDGRMDILVLRGPEQFDVYLSDAGTGFFQSGPALSFAAPIEARRVDTSDLNADGISDLFVQRALDAQITVYLSQSDPRKGTPK